LKPSPYHLFIINQFQRFGIHNGRGDEGEREGRKKKEREDMVGNTMIESAYLIK